MRCVNNCDSTVYKIILPILCRWVVNIFSSGIVDFTALVKLSLRDETCVTIESGIVVLDQSQIRRHSFGCEVAARLSDSNDLKFG